MDNPSNTLLQIANHIINQHPSLAQKIESIAAYAQGKGYGSTTIEQEINIAQQLLRKTPLLAIDIGGNIGDYTSEILKRNQDIEVHIFEPCAKNIANLRSRFNGHQNITIAPYAISDECGKATLFSDAPGSGMASLTRRRLNHFNIDFNTEETIEAMRFEDYWINTLNRRELDIVKLDIEGHELFALAGFGEAIFSSHLIQFEFGGCNIDTRTYFQDFWYFFLNKGFKIHRITPHGAELIHAYREADEFFSTTNYIAVNTNT